MLDAIRPYLALIRLVVSVLVAAVLFVGGCSYGKRGAEGELQAERARVDDLNRALTQFVGVFDRVNEQAELNRAAWQNAMDLANEAATRAEGYAAQYRAERDSIENEIDKAKADPGCRKLLETASCAVLQ